MHRQPAALRFDAAGWSELMRLEPGMYMSGESCVVHIKVVGDVEYLSEAGEVTETASSAAQRAWHLAWCQQNDTAPAPQIRA
jgi:hypothetical protein